MQVSIVRDDNMVVIDGKSATVDLSPIPPSYRAIQWDGTIGYVETKTGDKIPIRSLTAFNFAVNAALDIIAAEETITLDQAKLARRGEVDSLLYDKQAAGIPYQGKILQVRDDDQGRIGNMALKALLAKQNIVPWDDGTGGPVEWRMADDSALPIATPDAMLELAATSGAAVQQLRKTSWAHKNAIQALGTIEEVESYDINGGWPT